jgi:hypothetical protein
LISQGWDVTGVEPSAEACAIARQQGVDALHMVAVKPAAV